MLKKISQLSVFAVIIGLTTIAMTNMQVDPVADIALNVQGTVTDAETGEPIPDVEVQIEELAVSETTDEEGKFEFTDIQEGGIYTVVIEHDGYERYEETHEIKNQAQDQQMDYERQDDQNQQMQEDKNKGNKLEIELTPSNDTGIEN